MTSDVDRLAHLSRDVETTLIDWLPKGVGQHVPESPAYCVFLWYHDFSMDDAALSFGIGTTEFRDACVGRLKRSATEAIWTPQQMIDEPFPGFPFPGGNCDVVSAEVNEMYALMSAPYFEQLEKGETDEDGEKELNALAPLRHALHRVGLSLNKLAEWKEILPVTDDFIVFPTDFIGSWQCEDFEAAVPEERHQRLARQPWHPC